MGGIALATTLAQTLLSLILSRFVCRQLSLAWLPWIAKSCGLPLAVVGLATALRFWLPMHSWSQVALLAGAYLLLLLAVAWAVRFNVAFVRDEVRRLAAIFRA